ncbi:MAG: hypothetical protein ACOCVM_02325 [Desulfovibrionaceae bacterium]
MTRTALCAFALTLTILAAGAASAFDLSGVSRSLDTSPPEGTDALLTTQSNLKSELAGTLGGLRTSQSSMAKTLGDATGASRLMDMAGSLAGGGVGEGLVGKAMDMVMGYNQKLDNSGDKLAALGEKGQESIADSLLSYAKAANKLGLLDDKLLDAADQVQTLLEKASALQSASLMDRFSFLISTAPQVPDLASSASSTGKGLLDFCRSAGQNVSAAAKLLGY